MKCAWKQFLNLLPPTLRPQVDELGRERLQELRLRLQCRPLLVCGDGQYTLPVTVTQDMLGYVVNVACRYSPWTAESAAMVLEWITSPSFLSLIPQRRSAAATLSKQVSPVLRL